MKFIVYLVICLSTSVAFAKGADKKAARKPSSEKLTLESLKCSVDGGGADRVDVPVQSGVGQLSKFTNHKGHKVAVGFFRGDEFESQQLLELTLDGSTSSIYDPKESLYILTNEKGVRLQCYVAR